MVLLVASFWAGAAAATMQWQEFAGGGQGGGHAAHGGNHGAAARGLTLLDGDGASVSIVLPDLKRRPLQLTDGRLQLRPTGMDNYHLLLAERQGEGWYESALRYQYLSGRPSGHSPHELVSARKVPLEIEPLPLAREHAHYLSGTVPVFLLRFDGMPVVGQPIALETSNGTRLFARTDAEGKVRFPLPDDFGAVQAGRDVNRPADFTLYAQLAVHDGLEYRTSLSAEYEVNPRHWQSFGGGAWGGLAGFVAGLGFLRWAGRRGGAAGTREGRA